MNHYQRYIKELEEIFERYKSGRIVSDEELREKMAQLNRSGVELAILAMSIEYRYEDSLTDWDRDFLRTNRIQP